MNNHDPLFTFISSAPIRSKIKKGAECLTGSVTFLVNDVLARHLYANQVEAGLALFKMHKLELCRFAEAAVMLGVKGGAKLALSMWLDSKGVGEDDYSLETAYKLWQRYGWKHCAEKNSTFSVQSRAKAAAILNKKKRFMPKPAKPLSNMQLTMSQIELEMATNRFCAEAAMCYRRIPSKLPHHARIYFYLKYSGYSTRGVSRLLGIPQSTIIYATRRLQMELDRNLTFKRLMESALHDLEKVPTPSIHVRRITRDTAPMHPHPGSAQANPDNRSCRSSHAA